MNPLRCAEPVPEEKYLAAGSRQALLAVLLSASGALVLALSRRGVPGLLPAVITHGIAQDEHQIDVLALPMHPGSFQTGFDDQLVGTLDHARANRPARLLISRILHVSLAFLQIGQFLAQQSNSRMPGL